MKVKMQCMMWLIGNFFFLDLSTTQIDNNLSFGNEKKYKVPF